MTRLVRTEHKTALAPDYERSTNMRIFETLNHIYVNQYKAVIVVEVMSS